MTSTTRGPAARRGYEVMGNGIDSYRYLMTDCALRCGDALHEDVKYGAEVMRWRRLAAPSINRNWKHWVQLRDGYEDKVLGKVEGFWVDGNGRALEAGNRIPKDAYIGMEGAIQQILHDDGIYWVKERQRSATRGQYEKVLKERGEDEEAEDEETPEDDRLNGIRSR